MIEKLLTMQNFTFLNRTNLNEHYMKPTRRDIASLINLMANKSKLCKIRLNREARNTLAYTAKRSRSNFQ